MLYRLFLALFFCLCIDLLATEPVNFAFFEDKPQSLAKDFYIYEYLQRDETTPKEAKALFGMVHTMNIRFFHLFAKKMDNLEYKKISKCINLDVTALMKEDDECLNIGINIAKVTSLSKGQLPFIKPRITHNKELVNLITLMESDNVYEATLNSDINTFLTLFNGSITAYKAAIFNQQIIPKEQMDRLATSSRFNYLAYNVVQNDKLDNVQRSLLHVSPSLHVNAKALFYMGLNALKYDEKAQALAFFELSAERSTRSEEKDKALFWQYLVTKDARLLERIVQDGDINLYSLYAYEQLDRPLQNIVSPVLEGTHPTFNVSDPFAWIKVMNKVYSMSSQEVETLAQSFKYANTLPHYSYLMERATRYTKNYFPIPYPDEIASYSIHRQALMLSIARQESRFIPSVVSTSYALGMMQFMPFVARDIAKKEKLEDFDISSMFDHRVAYLFANLHLNFLERNLMHPLFIAYAYNGGMGFTKKHLQAGAFSHGEYEPFLSMESMINEESREYGKKVLANYVVYRHLLGEDVSIKNLFEMLLIPSVTDRFRN
ncbi:lytic murein transglycosylase domain-containing protein [Sulfurospirillum multivorans DSM 12446]|uniref:Lytic murein transglycosylase domain-containing protein n=2 Tax=Sulfurospirillum multivorans TaxID=66821 RepID=A0AA86AKD0_SULMK|nr:lytic murein transglycosylase domain-containing protein [Sulfurospirillum multivorans DSM 12446]QEH05652.1 lytic murein transglycosylase domain-containing protein [Sulfurospirillum multivorans]